MNLNTIRAAALCLLATASLSHVHAATGWDDELTLIAVAANAQNAEDTEFLHMYVAGFRDAYSYAQLELAMAANASEAAQFRVSTCAAAFSSDQLLMLALATNPNRSPAAALQRTLDALCYPDTHG